jgi:hypothetical protein
MKKEAGRGYDIFTISAHAAFELDVLIDKLYRFAESEVKRSAQGWRPEYLEYDDIDMAFRGLHFSGRIDRIDIREAGGRRSAFIIDYKFSNVSRLKNLRYNEKFTEFQLPLYRLMVGNKHPELDIEGFGYYDLKDRFELVTVVEHGTAGDFLMLLEGVIEEVLLPGTGFVKTDDLRLCMHCGFSRICGRKK